MFNHFFQEGSIVSVVLMAYAGNVMMEALRRERADPHGLHSPMIIKHSISTVLMVGALPCAIWPAIYVGLFDGWVAGVLAWIILQMLGAIGTLILGIRTRLLGFHFIAACVAYPVGYYLSISNLLDS
jgi:hypothetical protein